MKLICKSELMVAEEASKTLKMQILEGLKSPE